MTILGYFVLGIYLLCLLVIGIYCIFQFHLLTFYLRDRNLQVDIGETVSDSELPMVTVQLPMYNEYYVVERLIDNIVKLDYPKDKLEIQVLDDSTDDSLALTRSKVEEYQDCLLYTSPSPRDGLLSRMPSSA